MKRLHTRAAWVLIVALFLPLSACSAFSGSGSDSIGVERSNAGFDARNDAASPEMVPLDSTQASQQEAQIIQQAWLEIEVDSVEATVPEVITLVNEAEGRIDQRSMYRGESDSLTSASLEVRVPGEHLAQTIEQFGELGLIRNESTSAEDVTMQHIDLTARVESLSTSITRLEALLNDTANVSELIEVETALASRQAELESLTAQLEALTDEVQYATIFVELRTVSSPVSGGDTSFWDALVAGFWSIVTALNGLVLFVGYALPWLVLLGALSLIIIAVIKARARRRKTP